MGHPSLKQQRGVSRGRFNSRLGNGIFNPQSNKKGRYLSAAITPDVIHLGKRVCENKTARRAGWGEKTYVTEQGDLEVSM